MELRSGSTSLLKERNVSMRHMSGVELIEAKPRRGRKMQNPNTIHSEDIRATV